jgi:hypothetical protein
MPNPPISQSQRELLARLVAQSRVTVEQLRAAKVAAMDRATLARWLDSEVLGNQVDAKAHDAIDALFEEDTPTLPTGGSIKA